MKKFKNSRLSTDSRKLQTLALKDTTDEHLYPIEDSKPKMGNEFKEKNKNKEFENNTRTYIKSLSSYSKVFSVYASTL